MSLFGFDALGRLAFGQLPHQGLALSAVAGSFAMSGTAATFTISESDAASSFALTGIAATFTVKESPAAGAFAYTGVAASFTITENVTAGAFTLNGQPANETILEADQPGQFVVTTFPANLVRTGDDYEFKLGGVGHFKVALEEAKKLAAITRRSPPGFVDLRTTPTFQPFGGLPSAAPSPAPDLQAAAAQSAQAQMRAAKQRRDIEAILLLAA